MNRNANSFNQVMISPEGLALLGDGKIAYVKSIRSEDVPSLFPQAPEIAPGRILETLLEQSGVE